MIHWMGGMQVFVNDLISVAIDEKQHFRISCSMKLSNSNNQPNGKISQSEPFQNVKQHRIEGIFNKLDLWILQVDIQQDHHPSQINVWFVSKAICWCNSAASGAASVLIIDSGVNPINRQPQQQAWSLPWQIHLVTRVGQHDAPHTSLGHEPKHHSATLPVADLSIKLSDTRKRDSRTPQTRIPKTGIDQAKG